MKLQFADLPITGKPTEIRMGRGKGNPTGWIARVSTGQILFEMDGVSLSNARAPLIQITSGIAEKGVRVFLFYMNNENTKMPSVTKKIICFQSMGVISF